MSKHIQFKATPLKKSTSAAHRVGRVHRVRIADIEMDNNYEVRAEEKMRLCSVQ